METLKNLELPHDVLQHLERDLDLNEKISLVFLLYEDIPVAEERLFLTIRAHAECNDPIPNMNLLRDWSLRSDKNWKEKLIEGLLIIKAYSNIKKLGLDLHDLKDVFLPESAYTSEYINPIKKVLYMICEFLQYSDTEKIISHISSKHHEKVLALEYSNNVNSYDYEYFELFIMKLLRDGFIKTGSWNSMGSEGADIKQLAEILNSMGFENLFNNLVSSERYVNSRTVEIKKSTSSSFQSMDLKEDLSANNLKREEFKRGMKLEKKHFDSNVYKVINDKSMGIIMIINQIKFENESRPDLVRDLDERVGSILDEERLIKTWATFGFTSISHRNLNYSETMNLLQSIKFIADNEHSAFILCILSHGRKGVVLCCDGKPLEIETIQSMFNISKVPQLADKPKIIILQCCQGYEALQVVDPSTIETDLSVDGPNGLVTNSHIPDKSDMFVFWSTIPYHLSYRHQKEGTWFIQSLCDQLDNIEPGQSQSFFTLCTMVNADVSQKRHGPNGQMCEYTTSLRKTFYLKRNTV